MLTTAIDAGANSSWGISFMRVLTLERIRGTKIDDIAALERAGMDCRDLAERMSRIVLEMVFEHGFFHADPHPGNFFIEPDGRIGIIDFGMVGVVDQRTHEDLAAVFLVVTAQDARRLTETFLELGVAQGQVDRKGLERDLEHLVTSYYGRPAGEIAIGPLLHDVLAIVRRHHLQLQANLALLIKMLIMSEGLSAALDPGFRLTSVLTPYAQQLMLRQLSSALWLRRLGQASLDAARLSVEMPEQLRQIMRTLERGGLEVGVHPAGFEPVLYRVEKLVNRVVVGIIAAAFINGLAVLMSVYHPFGAEQWVGAFYLAPRSGNDASRFLSGCKLKMDGEMRSMRSAQSVPAD